MYRAHMRTIVAPRGTAGLIVPLLTLVVLAFLLLAATASGERRAGAGPRGAGTLPATAAGGSLPGDDGVQVRHLVTEGETFAGVLKEHGLGAMEIRAWEQAANEVFDLGGIKPGHAVHLTFARDQGRLAACEYEIDRYSILSLRLVHGQIQARLKAMPRLAAVRGLAGKVEASLSTSATAAGLPLRMVSELADLFGWEIDIQVDVQPGDEFRLLYAELRDEEGGPARPGDILAAEITSGGRTFTALRFDSERGERVYYDRDGRPLGRGFLRYPVEFTRITSTYTGARFHPILRRHRPHRGVDFSASAGTPVRAVASGVVTFAGRNGEYGNQVGIAHAPPYATSYAHLQRFARGVRPGASIGKGEVIGYVGRTGMATGPHLHFMLFENGEYVNPLAARLPTDEALAGARLRRFKHLRAQLLAQLAALVTPIELPSLSLAPPSLSELLRSNVASHVN